MADVGLIEKRGRWILPVDGREVTEITTDFPLGLVLEDVSIRIQCPFDLSYGRDTVRIDPQDTATLASLLVLRGVRVGSGIARKNGVLTLEFFDGRTITVPPDKSLEAWEVTAVQQAFRMVALPGGGVAVS